MTSKTLICLIGGLVAIEIASIFVVKWTGSIQNRILQQQLAGRTLESLDESQREEVLSSVSADYSHTIHRKIDLVVIAYHIPALASWGIATGQSTTPPLYYFAGTIAFWFAVLVGMIKVWARLSGP